VIGCIVFGACVALLIVLLHRLHVKKNTAVMSDMLRDKAKSDLGSPRPTAISQFNQSAVPLTDLPKPVQQPPASAHEIVIDL
jgi:hypothetical protein